MARKTKEEKRIENEISAAFYKFGGNIQFDIMDLPKIHQAGAVAAASGGSVEEAVKAAIENYRMVA